MNRPPKHATVDIPANGATDRTQLPNFECSSVTIQADPANTGAIFIGDSTVTNAGGTNPGIKLDPGDSLSNVAAQNLNWFFAATATAGNNVIYLIT